MHTRVSTLLIALILVSSLAGCVAPTESTDADAPHGSSDDQADEPAAVSREDDFSHLLTPEDVEGVTGMTGLVTMSFDPTVGAGGDVNIADSNGQLVVMVQADTGLWDSWQNDSVTVDRPSDPTIGDESFLGPLGSTDDDAYILGFRKGDIGVAVVAFFRTDSTRTLTLEQMYELAAIVEARVG